MKKTAFVVLVVTLVAARAQAEKLKGFIWEVSPSAIVVEGQMVRLGPETSIDRPNQKDITAKDLRIGWEVEVETRGEDSGLVARKVHVKNGRLQEETIEGIVDGVNHVRFFVDGDEVRLKKGTVPPGLKAGMPFKGKGIRQDDRSFELEDGQVMPATFEGEEAQFMAAAGQEIAQVKGQLKKINDPELQAYVDKVGRSLVPKWVDPQQFHFTFTLVDDPTLNAFAMPDGTVVIHSGLLAALENEAQLAAVLGHEITHTTHRHGYRGLKDQQKKQSLFGIGSLLAGVALGKTMDSNTAGLVTGLGTGLAYQAAVNGHGRKFEDQADEVGLYYMVEAGYDYMEAPEVWRLFGRYTKDQDKVSNFFLSDHSTHAARIKNLTRAINADYRTQTPRASLRTGEEDYRKAVERLKQQNAMANFQGQEYGRAQRGLAESLERNPNDANAHYNLGRVLWAQGGAKNAQQALDAYVAAIEADPTMAAPWRDIGVIFYELRDVKRAGQAFEKYLELAPNAPEAPQIRAFLDVLKNQ
ncbi:MAG TPA: tetratricopeptide repeat protein [Vicinamibacteria bacterium]|nr:tetratricopeptide repeat protein [Vicinamibacteria bacterium]